MPQPKNDFAFLRKWEKERKENKWRFAFRVGIFHNVLPIILIVAVYDVIKGIEDINQYLWIRVYLGGPIYLIIGLFSGWLMWRHNERRYKVLKGIDNK